MNDETYTHNRGMLDRMKGAAFLDVATYEEVEANSSLTLEAAGVVLLASIAAGIGAAGEGLLAAVGSGIGALIGWVVWAGVTYVIGDKVLDGTATWGELLRTLGFAQAPGVLLILAFIPFLGWIVGIGVGIWMLIAGVIAVRQALDFGTGKAIATVVIGWIAMIVLRGMWAVLF